MACMALAMAAALVVPLPPLAEAAPLQQPSQGHNARRLAAAQPRSLQQGAQSRQPCAISSIKAGPFWLGAAVTCLEFWPAPGAPIRVPQDTATTKYGQLVLANWTPVTATFQDRNGKVYPISPSVRVPNNTDVYLKSTPSVIVKATVDPKSGNVTAWSPEVYVPFRCDGVWPPFCLFLPPHRDQGGVVAPTPLTQRKKWLACRPPAAPSWPRCGTRSSRARC